MNRNSSIFYDSTQGDSEVQFSKTNTYTSGRHSARRSINISEEIALASEEFCNIKYSTQSLDDSDVSDESREEEHKSYVHSNLVNLDNPFCNAARIDEDEKEEYEESLEAHMPFIVKALKDKLKLRTDQRLKITMVTEKPQMSKKLAWI